MMNHPVRLFDLADEPALFSLLISEAGLIIYPEFSGSG
jgi:hypothetical protein